MWVNKKYYNINSLVKTEKKGRRKNSIYNFETHDWILSVLRRRAFFLSILTIGMSTNCSDILFSGYYCEK